MLINSRLPQSSLLSPAAPNRGHLRQQFSASSSNARESDLNAALGVVNGLSSIFCGGMAAAATTGFTQPLTPAPGALGGALAGALLSGSMAFTVMAGLGLLSEDAKDPLFSGIVAGVPAAILGGAYGALSGTKGNPWIAAPVGVLACIASATVGATFLGFFDKNR